MKKKIRIKKGLIRKLIKGLLREYGYFLVGLISINIKLLKELIKNTLLFIVGIFGIAYIVVPNLVSKTWYKTNKLVRSTIIYILIIMSLNSILLGNNVQAINSINKANEKIIINKVKIINKLVKNNKKLLKENESYQELKEQYNSLEYEYKRLKTIDSLNGIERNIYEKGIEVGLTHEESILAVAISKHETGKWTSSAFKNRHNMGGVMCSTGLKTYESLEDGIDDFVRLLHNRYFSKGLNTINKIGAVYCPIGASNDPKGVNVYWIPTVTKYYNEYMG